jgi:hypothetical protein
MVCECSPNKQISCNSWFNHKKSDEHARWLKENPEDTVDGKRKICLFPLIFIVDEKGQPMNAEDIAF